MKRKFSGLRTALRSRSLVVTASFVALSTAILWSPTSVSATGSELFNSTNLPTFASASLGASNGRWWAYKFTAVQSTTVGSVDVFVEDSAGSSNYFVQIATEYNTGSVGSFAPTAAETGLTCGGQACDRLTFSGSAGLTAGRDYWVWVGSSSSTTFVRVKIYNGASATTPGLPLEYTFATNDIKSSDGAVLDSATSGYPWIQMFAQPASEASSAPTPAVTLALDTGDNGSCSRRDVSSARGTWTQLPSAADCTPPAAQANATLLGWATNSGFPVAIAQRQVDNGWGAYETFDNDGRLTGVFIPAGGYTLASNSTTLHPIWSQ